MGRDLVAAAAYAQLRSAIVTGRLAAGTVLSEGRIAAELEISRTPVRQALRRLDLEGHIERDPRGRPIVHVLTARELAEIFDVRALLEGFGSRLAATRISEAELDRLAHIVELDWDAWRAGDVETLARLNREFHGLIMEASRNGALVEIVRRAPVADLRTQRLRRRHQGRPPPLRLRTRADARPAP